MSKQNTETTPQSENVYFEVSLRTNRNESIIGTKAFSCPVIAAKVAAAKQVQTIAIVQPVNLETGAYEIYAGLAGDDEPTRLGIFWPGTGLPKTDANGVKLTDANGNDVIDTGRLDMMNKSYPVIQRGENDAKPAQMWVYTHITLNPEADMSNRIAMKSAFAKAAILASKFIPFRTPVVHERVNIASEIEAMSFAEVAETADAVV